MLTMVFVASESRHIVQLFDSPETRADAVFAFAREGLLAGDNVLIVMTATHTESLLQRCRENGLDVDGAGDAGWLTLVDANETLARLMSTDRPDWVRFNASVGVMVRRLLKQGSRLRIYGEMVDILARANEFDAAQTLERFWNALQEREPFTLFCGYSAEHFGNPRDHATLRDICQLHTAVQADPRDILGNFLLRPRSAC
jgi:hypothetical protein